MSRAKSSSRNSTTSTEAATSRPSNRYRVHSVALLVVVVAMWLVLYGGVGLYRWWHTTHSKPAVSESFDVAEPDEGVISVTDQPPFTYAADEPKKIALPSVGASGYIQKVGKTKENAVGVPSNIHLAGWYTAGVKPGESGLSIIDGHLQGRYRDGIFRRLAELKPDDTIQITFGDDSIKEFQVVRVQSYPVDLAGQVLFVKDSSIVQQLNLITCGGDLNEDDRSYSERVLVVAKLVK